MKLKGLALDTETDLMDMSVREWLDHLDEYNLESIRNLQRVITYLNTKKTYNKKEELEDMDECCYDVPTPMKKLGGQGKTSKFNEGYAVIKKQLLDQEKNNWNTVHSTTGTLGHSSTGPNPSMSFQENLVSYGNAWAVTGTQYHTDDLFPPCKKEEDNMYTQIETERKYLATRLYNANYKKQDEASQKFLPKTEIPNTGKKLKEAIANGWLKVDLKDDDVVMHYDYLDYIRLEDPSKPKDEEGYRKALSTIEVDRKGAEDVIRVLPVDQGLKALQEFESKTYH